ncbi:MAG: hypothetical protein WCE56_03845 [Desulfobacterales bacterium]
MDYFNCENILKSVWDADHLPEGIVPLIHERTGGSPFFVEEISNALVEEETVRLNDRRAVLNRPLEKVSIPNTVQAVIRARLDRLDDYTPESLRLAINLAEELNMKPLLAHCHLKLGQHYIKMGKTDMARYRNEL